MIAFHLCEPGDTRLYHIPEFISIHYLGESRAVCMHVRPWANQAHLSYQHIDELRELINIGSPQQSTDPGYATIIS
jgi:hypothetical protein